MSVIKKKPFIEKVCDSLTDAQKTALQVQINASGNTIPHQIISGVEDGIHTYLLKLNEFLVQPCITIKTTNYSVALAYGNKQQMSIYNLDIAKGTYVEIKEYLTVEELRRIVFGGSGGGGGTVTPELLNELIKGEDDIGVDLSDDQAHLRVFPHYKRVKLSAPEAATSGSISDEEIAALQESKNSYITLNNEKYYLMDDEHTPGSLGYSHLGYENNKFVKKNLTITLSTKTWVLSVDEGGASDNTLLVRARVTGMNPDGTIVAKIDSDNIYQDLVDAKAATGKYPQVYGILDATILGDVYTDFRVKTYKEINGYIEMTAELITTNVTSGNLIGISAIELRFDNANKFIKVDIVSIPEPEKHFNIQIDEDSGQDTGYRVVSPNFFNEIKEYMNNTGKLPEITCEAFNVHGIKFNLLGGTFTSDTFMLTFGFRSKERPDENPYNFSINIALTADEQTVNFIEWEDVEGGGAPTYVIEVEGLDDDLTQFNVVSSNYADEIRAYMNSHHGELPNIQFRMGIRHINYTSNFARVEYNDNFLNVLGFFDSYYTPMIEIQLNVQMEYGHQGTADGQFCYVDKAGRPTPYYILGQQIGEIDGISYPILETDKIDQAFEAYREGRPVYVDWVAHPLGGGDHRYQVHAITDEDHIKMIHVSFEFGNEMIYKTDGSVVLKRNNYFIHNTAPTKGNNDGLLHIVKLDAEPAEYFDGYIYLIKE